MITRPRASGPGARWSHGAPSSPVLNRQNALEGRLWNTAFQWQALSQVLQPCPTKGQVGEKITGTKQELLLKAFFPLENNFCYLVMVQEEGLGRNLLVWVYALCDKWGSQYKGLNWTFLVFGNQPCPHGWIASLLRVGWPLAHCITPGILSPLGPIWCLLALQHNHFSAMYLKYCARVFPEVCFCAAKLRTGLLWRQVVPWKHNTVWKFKTG